MKQPDGDLLGDGVNIAARLEGMAEPSGICLSEDAFRQVRDKLKEIVIQLLHELAFRPDAVEHLKQQRTQITALAELRGGPRSRRASPGYVSARPAHRAQVPGPFSADGSLAHAPPVRCTKTARPDLQMCPACQPPPICDRKLNHDTLAMARVFQMG